MFQEPNCFLGAQINPCLLPSQSQSSVVICLLVCIIVAQGQNFALLAEDTQRHVKSEVGGRTQRTQQIQ